MSASTMEDEGREQNLAAGATIDSSPVAASRPSANRKALIVGLIVAVAGAWIAATLADRFRVVENVDRGIKAQYMFGGTRLDIGRATRNAEVAYGLVGAILSLVLGAIAGCFLGHFSMPRVLAAGLLGVALGSALGVGSSYGLTPVYFHRMGTADVALTLLIHLGIWSAVGAAAGAAFGVGSGSRDVLVKAVVGGIIGAALGAILFDIAGSLFPLARSERPLSEEAGTRLVANIVLCVCVVVGTVVVASQQTRVTANKA